MNDFTKYQELAMRTRGTYSPRSFSENEQQLICGALGLAGESGEFVDAIKKYFFHSKPIPDDLLSKEIGAALWYMALICDAKGWSLAAIADANIEKLRRRYPEGFTYIAATQRKDLGEN